ncbi:hypothetical protein HPB52_009146 [Rhipicephalus sanguineus]|uniref:Uncharacterized protein n=1 Tax=Rhipicephalus sanguineus TaxID=34632 RepID=A0A9D4Q988_RHISA|nr:hypothetical protein HPB52_009146 [Rhipicephalus sanguineus]
MVPHHSPLPISILTAHDQHQAPPTSSSTKASAAHWTLLGHGGTSGMRTSDDPFVCLVQSGNCCTTVWQQRASAPPTPFRAEVSRDAVPVTSLSAKFSRNKSTAQVLPFLCDRLPQRIGRAAAVGSCGQSFLQHAPDIFYGIQVGATWRPLELANSMFF